MLTTIYEVIHITSKIVTILYLLFTLLIFLIAIFPSIGNILSSKDILFFVFISLLFLIPWITDDVLALTLGTIEAIKIFAIIISTEAIIYFISNTNLNVYPASINILFKSSIIILEQNTEIIPPNIIPIIPIIMPS